MCQRRAIYDIRVGKQYCDKLLIQVYQRWVVYDFRVGKQYCDKLPIQVYQCRVEKQCCDKLQLDCSCQPSTDGEK